MKTYWAEFLQVISVVGCLETLLLLVAFGYGLILWAKGVFPALLRLGNGLAKRKVAIFAKGNNLSSLNELLVDSKLFSSLNIIPITKLEDLGKSEKATLFIVYWSDWAKEIYKILDKKSDSSALIVYAPRSEGLIPEEDMKALDGHRNTAITNFRGRLLNDVVSAMMTTGYKTS